MKFVFSFALLLASFAAHAAPEMSAYLGSTGTFKKSSNTLQVADLGCVQADKIQVIPRYSYQEVGEYSPNAKFWLRHIEFAYADGSTAHYDSGFFMDPVFTFHDRVYDVPAASSCLRTITILGRSDCKIGSAHFCKSMAVDVYSAQ